MERGNAGRIRTGYLCCTEQLWYSSPAWREVSIIYDILLLRNGWGDK